MFLQFIYEDRTISLLNLAISSKFKYIAYSLYRSLSKKNLDYRDWKKIVSIKVSKKHLTPEGKELILHLGDKMNKNRLSTNLNSLNTQTLSDKEINIRLNNLLLEESNGK